MKSSVHAEVRPLRSGWCPTSETRALLLTRLTGASLICSMLISWPLWRADREYPRVPAFAIWSPPAPFDAIWSVLFFAVVAWLIVHGRGRGAVVMLVVLTAWWCAADQSRLQPWFWQYIWMLAVLNLRSPNDDASANRALGACALIVAGTYFWSGWQKFNGGFVRNTFPWLLAPFVGGRPSSGPWLSAAGWLTGPIEASAGMMLLIPRCRPCAVGFLTVMHVLILASVGPLGQNWNLVVWPWNAFMVATMVLLFTGGRSPRPGILPLARRDFAGAWLVGVVWWLLPAASFGGWWDAYLSSALYSGATLRGTVEVRRNVLDLLPEPCRRMARPSAPGRHDVPILDWSLAAVGASAYPARRVLLGVAQAVADHAQGPGEVALLIDERPEWRTGVRQRTRIELVPRASPPGARASARQQ